MGVGEGAGGAVRSRAHLQCTPPTGATKNLRNNKPADFTAVFCVAGTPKVRCQRTPGGPSRNQSFKSRPRPFFFVLNSYIIYSMKGNRCV